MGKEVHIAPDHRSMYEQCVFQEDLFHILIHILLILHPKFELLIYRQIKKSLCVYIYIDG